MTVLSQVLDALLVLLLLHTVVNAFLLRRAPAHATVQERVSILLPVRNEAQRVGPSLQSLLAQEGLADHELLVYNDESTDDTTVVVRQIAGDAARLVPTQPLPNGWLGKPHACAQLAAAASGSVLVFLDADVILVPDAVARSISLMRARGLAFVSPYPRQLTGSWLERLVQPLLQWSWLALLPLRIAERSSRPSLSAANGQFLVVDAETYRRSGGHPAVRSAVVDDVALARQLKQTGGRGGFVDGSDLAQCRMYDGGRALVDGYAKSLWVAFGSPADAVAVAAFLVFLGVVPWLLLGFTWWAAPAAAAGVLSRHVAALRAGNRPVADGIGHPLSVLAFTFVVFVSVFRHARGRLAWKGRPLP